MNGYGMLHVFDWWKAVKSAKQDKAMSLRLDKTTTLGEAREDRVDTNPAAFCSPSSIKSRAYMESGYCGEMTCRYDNDRPKMTEAI